MVETSMYQYKLTDELKRIVIQDGIKDGAVTYDKVTLTSNYIEFYGKNNLLLATLDIPRLGLMLLNEDTVTINMCGTIKVQVL